MHNQSETAEILLKNSFIANLALGFEPEIESANKWQALKQYHIENFNYVFLHIATDATSLERTIQSIAYLTARIKDSSDYKLIKSYADILEAKRSSKLGIGFIFQGTNPIDKNLDMIDLYYQLGVRSMILSYNIRNAVGDGCAETTDAGLSKLGVKVIERMNEVGMLIDCSHTGHKSSLDAMHHSKAPVIFSHSNAHQLAPHPRNLTDELIKACAATGGLIGINGVGVLLNDEAASPEKFVEHIDYIAQLIGTEHIALGFDEIYFPEIMADFMEKNKVMYPPDYSKTKKTTANWNCIRPHQIKNIIELLLQRNYAEESIKNILGGNYLRVIQQVWR